MASATLTIDLDAIVRNWRALNSFSAASVRTGAVVKADAYGTGVRRISARLAREGVKEFFVAMAEEGASLREAIGPGPEIFVFSGHMRGDANAIADLELTPLLNSAEQVRRHLEALPDAKFGLQLDTGMNRLGIERADWESMRGETLARRPSLIMSHLACADDPDHSMNAQQLAQFQEMTEGVDVPRSLSATGGILLGQSYHFDVTRPGIGLYAGAPFDDGDPAVKLSLPVIQIRQVEPGETVGYGNTWTAERRSRIATVSAGYADGLLRRAGVGGLMAFCEDVACPVVGRISMDLITVDVTDTLQDPDQLEILCDVQTVDDYADAAETIGYEVLTALGARYARKYIGA